MANVTCARASRERRSLAGAGGSFLDLKYGARTGQLVPQSLAGGISSAGQIFFTYHLSRNQWSGVQYEVQQMSFGGSALVNSFFYTHRLSLARSHAISLYVGPQQSSTPGEPGLAPPHTAQYLPGTPAWNWAGGITYTWKTAGGGAKLAFNRRIDSSSALPGAAMIVSATADLRHSIGRRWNAGSAI